MSQPVRSVASFDLERELGRGGMGVVWLGRDRRLGRQVAVKMLRDEGDPTARERLLREARVAASVNHPNVCQVYEVGEDGGVLYIAMELLEGRSLAERMAEGALPLGECVSILAEVLAALGTIHERGLVHRDVKPSNVFLTSYGAKLLDFGLARGDDAGGLDETRQALTNEGTTVGTPRYMAPEQWRGGRVGPAADLWAAGVLLYEMLSGGPAFTGRSFGELYEAIVQREPPALSGGPAAVAADRVVQRALQKRPEERFPSAQAMADAVRSQAPGSGPVGAAEFRSLTRLIVLPFRSLRPDPDTDFLSVSLPDAISGALASIDSLVVRSRVSAVSAAEDPDLPTIAREAGVDAVVTGTLLRDGGRVRVTAQLLEAPAGTVMWSRNVEGVLGDLFALQDSIVHEILDSLTLKLSRGEEERLERGAAATARAYELYLRGNQVAVSSVQESGLLAARDFYRGCLKLDPGYAPAWARVARVYRVLS
ncbi:MAG TPA: serine/threonine-protein kinase, partial [bacterium]|nr:serine/threonine-protein kinase [bacterium]